MARSCSARVKDGLRFVSLYAVRSAIACAIVSCGRHGLRRELACQTLSHRFLATGENETVGRPVFWLPDHSRAEPSRRLDLLQSASGVVRRLSPDTATGSRRIRTGFPQLQQTCCAESPRGTRYDATLEGTFYRFFELVQYHLGRTKARCQGPDSATFRPLRPGTEGRVSAPTLPDHASSAVYSLKHPNLGCFLSPPSHGDSIEGSAYHRFDHGLTADVKAPGLGASAISPSVMV